MKYLVGLDEGTTGCKVCVFSEKGKQMASSEKEYRSYYPELGYVEQDISEIQDSVFAACKEAISASGIDPEDIVGVSHSNQGIAMVLLDENDNLLSNRVVGWQDMRYVEVLPEMRKEIFDDEYFDIAGMTLGTYNTPVLKWHQKHSPELWSKVAHVTSHQDYFLKALGADGYFIDEGCANFMCMLETETREWSSRLVELYGLKPEQLSKIVHEPGKVVGHVTKEVSEKTGLPTGCCVCLGALDTNTCTFAAGGIKKGVEVLVVGTAGVSTLIVDEPLRDENKRVTLRSNPGTDLWQLYIMTNTGASAFRWFRDALCSLEVATSSLLGSDPYNLMTDIALNSKPGANGVTALTCLQGSHTRMKNEHARGTFLGITLGTTKADLAEAVLESICFEMRDLVQMKTDMGADIDTVRLCGGVTKSPMWCQMFADILKKPVELTEVTEMGSLGAAMFAGIGSGLFTDMEDAVDSCVHIAKTFVPNPERSASYDRAFDLWNEAYDILNNSYYIERD